MTTTLLERDERTAEETPAVGLVVGPEPLAGGEPGAWRSEARAAAWQRFQSLPMPARTDEAWRFANLKAIDPAAYVPGQAVSPEIAQELLTRSQGLAAIAGRMVFANDRLLAREALSDSLASRGVTWLPIEQIGEKQRALFEQRFMQEEAALGGQKYAALHEAWVRNGTFLHIPRGVELELPLEAHHWLHGENAACFPHTLIVAEENSRVTFVDYFTSSEAEAPGFAVGVNDLWLGTGAKVSYVNIQQWGRQVRSVQINSTVVGRDAAAIALNAHFGSAYARSESISHLRGQGGRSDMLSLAVADGRREIDQRTLQIHEVPNTSSDLLYKNSLDDQARSIFAGLIRVLPGAHFTDAYQKVRNVLLSDEAEANSAPGLEIEADNVRCTHGATSGQIEEEELFYLLSRGINRKAAQRLIVLGFLQEVIDRLPCEAAREKLQGMLQERFSR